MSRGLALRLMQRADLEFADRVRALAGWNQTLEDWQRFLWLEPAGCFVAEWNGTLAGTATTLVYGSELGWIGMLLVHPDYRRRGIGTALLERCLDYLRDRQVRCIKLDATPAGKQVYDGLGFRSEWTLTRWVNVNQPARRPTREPRIHDWQAEDTPLIERLDAVAFGASRHRLMPLLARQSRSAVVLESEPGRVAGFGLLRSGSRALYLGPVIAQGVQAALPLLVALAANSAEQTVFWDIPDQNTAAVAWAEQEGFTRQRSLTRMYLGENTAPSRPQQQFGVAGPELG